MKLAWLTDVHLNFLAPGDVAAFLRALEDTPYGALVLTGDTGEAPDLARYLPAQMAGQS